MPQMRSRGQGQPAIHPLPQRIGSSPEHIARAFFCSSGTRDTVPRNCNCRSCGSQVIYPDIQFNNGNCLQVSPVGEC